MRFHQLLHKMFDAQHLHKVEILFARDWKLGDANKPETQTPYRTTWASGWWIDQVTKLFEGDISPHTQRGKRHTVLSEADLHQEQKLYESELRLASRIRGKGKVVDGKEVKEILEASAAESQAQVVIRASPTAAATSIARAVSAAQLKRPLTPNPEPQLGPDPNP